MKTTFRTTLTARYIAIVDGIDSMAEALYGMLPASYYATDIQSMIEPLLRDLKDMGRKVDWSILVEAASLAKIDAAMLRKGIALAYKAATGKKFPAALITLHMRRFYGATNKTANSGGGAKGKGGTSKPFSAKDMIARFEKDLEFLDKAPKSQAIVTAKAAVNSALVALRAIA